MKTILAILFRRKREAALFAICMVFFPLSISYLVTEKYESTATVLLTAGRFKKPFLPNEKNSQTGFIQVSMEDVASEVELLMSRPVLEKVVRDNQLYIFPEPAEHEYLKRIAAALKKGFNWLLVAVDLKKEMTDFELAVEKLENDLDVEFLKRTNIITIEWRGFTPEQARNVVDSVVREYIRHHIEVHGYGSALNVIEKEMHADQERVKAAEQQVHQVKAQYGSFELDKERDVLLGKYISAQSIYENLRSTGDGAVAFGEGGANGDDAGFARLKQDLVRVELERIANLSNYGEGNKRIAVNDQQIASLKSQIKAAHQENMAAWKIAAERFKDRLNKLDMVREKIASMNRELAGALDAYQISRQKYNEAVIAAAMDKADVASARIVAPASYNSTPAFPRKILLLVVSLFFALVGGVAAAFAADKMYSRIVDIDEIQRFGRVATLLTVPRFGQKDLAERKGVTRRLFKQMAAVRKFLADTPAQAKVHLVVSPSPGVGTSFIATYLARYAYVATRQPSVFITLGAAGASSEVDLSSTTEALLQRLVKGDETDVLALGLPQDSAFDGDSFGRLLGALKAIGYANMIVDLPNERGDSNYINIIPFCDHVFLNIGYDITDKFALDRYASVIGEQFDLMPAGAFLNLRRNEIPEFIYRRL